jgi:hypothetical protein
VLRSASDPPARRNVGGNSGAAAGWRCAESIALFPRLLRRSGPAASDSGTAPNSNCSDRGTYRARPAGFGGMGRRHLPLAAGRFFQHGTQDGNPGARTRRAVHADTDSASGTGLCRLEMMFDGVDCYSLAYPHDRAQIQHSKLWPDLLRQFVATAMQHPERAC